MFTIYCKKANETLTIDFNSYPEHVKQHIIEYGLKQKFNDCLASETDMNNCKGLLTNLAERLLRGELAKRGTGTNPVEARARSLLRKVYLAKIGGKSAEVNKLSIDALAADLAKALNKPAEKIISHFNTIAEGQIAKEREEQASLLGDLVID